MENFSVKKLIGEVLGTLALVLVVTGTAVFSGGALSVALAFGLTTAVLMSVGGGYYNPAVSLAAAIDKRISWVEFLIQAIAQIIGGLLAAVILWIVTGATTNLGASSFGPAVVLHAGDQGKGMMSALIVETIATFFFVLAILRATRPNEDGEKSNLATVIVGFAAIVLVGFAFGVSGGSLNPARSLGPALLQGGAALEMMWVYLVAPLLGGALGAIVHKVL